MASPAPSEPITVPFHTEMWLERRFNIAGNANAMPFTAAISSVSLVVAAVGDRIADSAGADFLEMLAKGDVDPAKSAERFATQKKSGGKRGRKDGDDDEAEEEVDAAKEKVPPARAERDHFVVVGILRSGKELCLTHLSPVATPPIPSSSRTVVGKDGEVSTLDSAIVAKALSPLRMTFRHNVGGAGRARDHLVALELRRCSGYAVPPHFRVTAVLHGAQTVLLTPQQLTALSGGK